MNHSMNESVLQTLIQIQKQKIQLLQQQLQLQTQPSNFQNMDQQISKLPMQKQISTSNQNLKESVSKFKEVTSKESTDFLFKQVSAQIDFDILQPKINASMENQSTYNSQISQIPQYQLEQFSNLVRSRLSYLGDSQQGEIPNLMSGLGSYLLEDYPYASKTSNLDNGYLHSLLKQCKSPLTKTQEEFSTESQLKIQSTSSINESRDSPYYLDPQIENTFTSIAQKRRRRLIEVLKQKRDHEIVIKPYSKSFKGQDIDNFRGSKYRGISKNGNSWQILVMVHKKKQYLGTLPSEEQAAKFYDRVAIQYQGIKAKTNFSYNKAQVFAFIKQKPLIFKS